MADDASGGSAAASPADYFSQLAAMTATMWGLDPAATPDRPTMPAFGAMSAQQFTAMAATVKAQRESIAALQTQLQAFDEHLATMQKFLEPMLAWSRSRAALEKQTGLRPGSTDPA